VFDGFNNGLYGGWGLATPAVQFHVGYGYDPEAYISTAKIQPSPYTTQELIQAKFQGLADLITATDDDNTGNIGQATLDSIVQNVTTEINGYLSTCYPIPLVQTGTITVLQVSEISEDGLGTVTALKIIEGGNYAVAPDGDQFPAYLRYLDPLINESFWGCNWQFCQQGTGLEITVAYVNTDYSDESGQLLQAKTVTAVPTIVNGGSNYNCGDLIVLVGGQSFVPAKIREAALSLICHDLLQRRLTPSETNLYEMNNCKWRGDKTNDGLLTKIGDGDAPLDGTYKRFYSAGQSWNDRSVLYDANSL
jgi:Bacteriophage Mu, Gp36